VAAASVHLRTAELLEHKASVQSVDMAVLAMHVVGIVHELIPFGSQQPWTPLRVLVAQTKLELEHVIEDAFELLGSVNNSSQCVCT